MKTVSPNADLGGGPFTKADLRTIFNQEFWDVLQGMCSDFDSQPQGIVVTGCGLTTNSGNFDMAAGIVYLNGKFMRLAAATNQAFPKYIVPDTPVDDTRIFSDGGSHVLATTYSATLSASTPVSGQYIALTNYADPFHRSVFRGKSFFSNISLATGWGAFSGLTPQVGRDLQNRINLRGWLATTSGSENFKFCNAGALPSARPGTEVHFVKPYTAHGGGASYTGYVIVRIMDDGSGYIDKAPAWSNNAAIDVAVSLEGCSYIPAHPQSADL